MLPVEGACGTQYLPAPSAGTLKSCLEKLPRKGKSLLTAKHSEQKGPRSIADGGISVAGSVKSHKAESITLGLSFMVSYNNLAVVFIFCLNLLLPLETTCDLTFDDCLLTGKEMEPGRISPTHAGRR